MRRYVLIGMLGFLLASNAFAQSAPETASAPDHRQLLADWQALTASTLPHFAKDLEEYIQGAQRYEAKIQADSEAQKTTLIEWLKAAQAQAAAAHTAQK